MDKDEVAREVFACLGVGVEAKEGEEEVRRGRGRSDWDAEEGQDLLEDRTSVPSPG